MPLFEAPKAGELPALKLLDDPPPHEPSYSSEALEALSRAVVDLSGRPYFAWDVPFDKEMLLVTPEFPFALVEEFFKSVAFRGRLNLHAALLVAGRNGHHAAEASPRRSPLARAIAPSGDGEIASTKNWREVVVPDLGLSNLWSARRA